MQRSITFYVILGAVLFVFIQSFRLLSPILLSFLLVMLITMAVNPVIARMMAFCGGRKKATGLLVGTLVVVVALTGWAAFGPMKDAVTTLSVKMPAYWERLQKPLIKMEQKAVLSEDKLQAEVSSEISREAAQEGHFEGSREIAQAPQPEATKKTGPLRSGLIEMLQGVVGSFTSMAFNGTHILVVLVTVFFGAIFTLMNPHPIFRGIFSLVPERYHEQTMIIVRRIGEFVPRWVGMQLLGMLTVGLLVFLFMWPIFGLMDALVLGLIAFIFEAIPFLGPILSAVPAILLSLDQGGMAPLWVLLAYIAIQAVENNLLIPFIMSRGLKMHPLAVIFSMLLCVAAFGVLGFLIAAPMVAIIAICHDELYRKRFLPTTTDADMDNLAKKSLFER